MTPAQLRAALATLLADVLGTYSVPNVPGATPAIRVGNPPSDWTVTGVEAIIGTTPDMDNTPLYGAEHNLAETHLVRLVQHGTPGKLSQATRRVVRAYSDSTVTRIDGNERLGILDQVIIRIPN